MVGTSDKTDEYVLEVLESADDPLSASRIQHRLADEGLDATTGAITDACARLRDDGKVEITGDPKTPKFYRVADTGERVREYVRSVLESADGPLSTGRIQQRLADEGLDATTSAIDAVCNELVATEELEPVDDSSKRRYRVRE